jgi:hypothetical protein
MEKSLKTQRKSLPTNHPHLAATYNNIAEMHLLMNNNSAAYSNFKNAYEIWKKSLLPNHSWLAISYNNIAELQRAN